MARLDLIDKLAVLADAAKYDASCASSGTTRRHALSGAGAKGEGRQARMPGALGSTEGSGICHAYAPDGRCISLLKILLTNYCMFDCVYCINRKSSNVRRARFTPGEVVRLTLDFYKRNYIEGLFLSSGIIRSPDYTMEQIVEVARSLRCDHDFRGYIHLKTIPEASPDLLDRAGRYADRLSINIELPSTASLARLAPEKDMVGIRRAMGGLRARIDERRGERRSRAKPPAFAPAGQSTQMIVGADGEPDTTILRLSDDLYSGYRLRRVYYSAFSPIPDADTRLPPRPPPLVREHRLYQADWLLRFYGFDIDEVAAATTAGMLDLEADPKQVWALRHRHHFPVDLNRGPREMLLRVPGLGVKTVDRVVRARRWRRLRLADLARLTRGAQRAMPFIETDDWHPGNALDGLGLTRPVRQLDLFEAA
ncbi:MAG: putative DNA modification/repair radical SAM protein [Geminicoccaceae bacterium]|nr:putative DNA modification/repair radical SAM protein [Geminicoccaceae bacterium]